MNQSLNKLNPQHYFEIHTPLQKQAEDNKHKISETSRGGKMRFLRQLLSVTRQENKEILTSKKKTKSGQYSK